MIAPAFRIDADGVAVPFPAATEVLLAGAPLVAHRLRQQQPFDLREDGGDLPTGYDAVLYLPAGERVTADHCAAVERAMARR